MQVHHQRSREKRLNARHKSRSVGIPDQQVEKAGLEISQLCANRKVKLSLRYNVHDSIRARSIQLARTLHVNYRLLLIPSPPRLLGSTKLIFRNAQLLRQSDAL